MAIMRDDELADLRGDPDETVQDLLDTIDALKTLLRDKEHAYDRLVLERLK